VADHYRPVDRDQVYLLPPSMAEWLPREHPVWFVIEVIADLGPRLPAFRRRVLGGTGRAPYDPVLLVTLLVYAAWQGVRSSRQIEARCHTDVAFRIVCAQDPPDHTTIARFRQAHAAAFTDLFTEVLLLCAREGMGRFGKVAIDGTKVAANASKAANLTLKRVREIAEEEVAAGLAADADADADADVPPPPSLRDRSHRRQRLARVHAELEAEQAARDAAATAQRDKAAEYTAAVAAGTAGPGRVPAGADPVEVARLRLQRARAEQQAKIDEWEREKAKPLTERTRTYLGPRPAPVPDAAEVRRARQCLDRAQQQATTSGPATTAETTRPQPAAKRNLTDPDSRLMPAKDGWVQGFNVQASVGEDHLILGVKVTDNPSDTGQAVPMMRTTQAAADAIAEETGRDDTTIGTALFDAGYDSNDNLTAPGPERLIANAKRHTQERAAATKPASGSPPPDATPRQAMDHRLRTPAGIRAYRRRGAIVEPIFGHLKDTLGLRRFLTRGLTNVTGEVNLAAATLNLRRLHTYIAQAATT
jgi:transposase